MRGRSRKVWLLLHPPWLPVVCGWKHMGSARYKIPVSRMVVHFCPYSNCFMAPTGRRTKRVQPRCTRARTQSETQRHLSDEWMPTEKREGECEWLDRRRGAESVRGGRQDRNGDGLARRIVAAGRCDKVNLRRSGREHWMSRPFTEIYSPLVWHEYCSWASRQSGNSCPLWTTG